MYKKSLLLYLFLSLVLSGCLTKNQTPENTNIDNNPEPTEKSSLNSKQETENNVPAPKNIIEEKTNLVQPIVREVVVPEKITPTDGSIKGSCDDVAKNSTCTEYIGSIWTEAQMKAACQGLGEYSLQACPADMVGGCNIGFGAAGEMTTWLYTRGGAGLTQTVINNSGIMCKANKAARWVKK